MSADTAIYGIVGRNISYSLSPAIYRALFRRFGIDAIYNRFDLVPGQLKQFLKAAVALPVAGFNVTIPYKESITRCIDNRDTIVSATESTNLIINRRSALRAFNTDYLGIAATIEDRLRCDVRGAKIMLLGSGGSARTAFYYLVKQRAASISVFHRSRSREQSFSAWAGTVRKRTQYYSAMIKTPAVMPDKIDLAINCTPAEITRLIHPGFVAELPRIFELRYGTMTNSRRHVGGEYMLAVQAAENFRIMTGIVVPADHIMRTIRRASQ